MNNKSVYIPAHSGRYQNSTFLHDRKHLLNTDKSLRYYNSDGIYYYPYILVSAGPWYKKKNYANEIGIDLKKTLMLGDSGGYQLATGVLKYTPSVVEEIFNWLENNTNYAINLDLPMYINSDVKLIENKENKEYKIKISKENFDYFYKNQSGKTKYLNVLHGRTLEDLDLWYDAVKEYDFPGGWAIGGAAINNFYILQSFFYLYEKGRLHEFKDTKALLHILGFSRLQSLYVPLYLQKKLNEKDVNIKITFDSSAPTQLAIRGQYIFDLPGRRQLLNFNKKTGIIDKDIKLPCNCPVCKGVSYKSFCDHCIEEVNNEFTYKNDFYCILSLHNTYKYLEYVSKIDTILNTGSTEHYRDLFNEHQLTTIDIINKAFEAESPLKFILEHEDYLKKGKQGLDEEAEITKHTLF